MDKQQNQLAVVIHTEEEFDWEGGFYRSHHQVTHGARLVSFINEMVAEGAKVTLAMDYAFVNSSEGQEAIAELKNNSVASIEFAAHLHPWVNPPYSGEDQCPESDSYPGNLPADMEFEKLSALTEKITEVVGVRPVSYLAGRYGIGSNTKGTLKQLGYQIDLSITPFTSYRHQQGPDFSRYSNLMSSEKNILNVPHTTGLVSVFPAVAAWLNTSPKTYQSLNASIVGCFMLKLLRVKKWRLSPEGFSLIEMKKLVETLKQVGIQHYIYSFHSPSVVPGNTPYVPDEAAFEQFREDTLAFLRWFKGDFVMAKEFYRSQDERPVGEAQ